MLARLPILAFCLAAVGCAQQSGGPGIKVFHGDIDPPAFHLLNYAVDFGRRCSPPDQAGDIYASYVWFRTNSPEGDYAPLRAAAEHCQ
ncbi:MAG: hypothetical protein QF578_11495 [Alphaproteobacteria bacterium]|jgi:hypothetical protein|nr:hypothetical protein [Alphaproteobacteria bacterium]MDP6565441.1 hypothetical protein [Alphaproteobacteria bacterium]MDP6814462.1 hypothetical protein [Alphaproteobacteria bacterium]